MNGILLVAAGGFLGAIARFAASQYISARVRSPLPYGTLFVNVAGSALLGCIAAWDRTTVSLLLGTGFMGAFTTFSTLKAEGVRLWKGSAFKVLFLYYTFTYTLGIAGAWAGYSLVSRLAS